MEKKKLTQELIDVSREQGVSVMEQLIQMTVKSESFVSDDCEIEPVVKKRKDSAFDSIMLELKLMDENKTKRAVIILKKFLIPILFLLVKRIMFSILKMNLKE